MSIIVSNLTFYAWKLEGIADLNLAVSKKHSGQFIKFLKNSDDFIVSTKKILEQNPRHLDAKTTKLSVSKEFKKVHFAFEELRPDFVVADLKERDLVLIIPNLLRESLEAEFIEAQSNAYIYSCYLPLIKSGNDNIEECKLNIWACFENEIVYL